MTAGKLIEELKKYPSDMDVCIAERVTEFEYGLLNSVRMEEVEFREEGSRTVHAPATIIILDEE